MKRLNFLFLAAMALVIASCSNNSPQPPVALKKAYVIESNGNMRTDDYFWMRLSDEQKNAEVA
ncbi:MAG: hypothetical protein MUP53_02320, partial [Bacteroidales bacterium]|nr:hypothetical protein [Bacteroidales bacterium]